MPELIYVIQLNQRELDITIECLYSWGANEPVGSKFRTACSKLAARLEERRNYNEPAA